MKKNKKKLSSTKIKFEDKLFYSISEVSRITGIKPYVLRYWETEFKLLNPQKNLGGQRTYRKKDIEIILKIKELLYEQKYTIDGAKKKLKEMKESNHQLEFSTNKIDIQRNVPSNEVLEKLKSQLKSLLDFLNSKE